VDQDFLGLPARPAGSAKRARLAAALQAEDARTRARALRDTLVALLAVASVPLWPLALWPGRVAAQVRNLFAAAWAVAFAAVLCSLAYLWICARRRHERIAELGPLPVLRSARPQAGACVDPPDEED
jgi:hypothetical protein